MGGVFISDSYALNAALPDSSNLVQVNDLMSKTTVLQSVGGFLAASEVQDLNQF